MSKRIVFWPSLVACYDDSSPDSILFSQVIEAVVGCYLWTMQLA
jgi:hypothetical protein